MRALSRHMRHLVLRLGAARDGVAAVEFALILPFLLVLYMGSIELSQLISVDRRVSTVAGTLGDLVARADSSLAASDLQDYFLAATATMAPYNTDDLEQIVTSLHVDDGGAASVRWSRPFNGATPHLTGSSYELPDEIAAIAAGGYVIVSEARTSYRPLVGYVFPTALNLYKEYFHLPRFGDEIVIED